LRREGEEPGDQDPNAMDVDRTRRWGDDQRCYNCRMFGHMAQHCRNPKEVRGGMQEVLKDQGDQ